jgi:hypothetical protein
MTVMDQKRKTKKKIPPAVVLRDTFFNRNLLDRNPFELRDELFLEHTKDQGWGIVENLLWAIEHEAELVLKGKARLEDPLGGPYSEKDIFEIYGHSKLPSDQANAIAALRSIQQIRKEFRLREVHAGQYILDGIERGVEQTYDSRTVAKLVLEAALLVMAAFRGDFWGKYWDDIERSVRRRFHLREASSLGTNKLKERAAVLRKKCVEIAKSAPKGLTQGGRAQFVQRRLPKRSRPSLRRIKDLIK